MNRKTGIRIVELIALLALLVVIAVLLLPMVPRARQASRQASCANNLKQIGLVCKMFANESRGERWPPLSPVPHNWMMDANALFPEYASDLSIFICPSSPFAHADTFRLKRRIEHPGAPVGEFHPDCVWSLCYIYTGWCMFVDDQALALYDAYFERPEEVIAGSDITLTVPAWDPAGGPLAAQSSIPAVWDRVPLDEREFAHVPYGCNVLYMDGHVEFREYAYYNPPNAFPVTRASAETFGSVLPRLSQDCY
ncbi:MAG: DUF1559 domain-containing protein [Candidatus Hydrogenedentes bacterium]|nr:DUF1559 domain-containing protein [Candidatus Hydrogenedentota bacterium]